MIVHRILLPSCEIRRKSWLDDRCKFMRHKCIQLGQKVDIVDGPWSRSRLTRNKDRAVVHVIRTRTYRLKCSMGNSA